MIYVECKQKIISATTISFSGNVISDSGSGFGDFNQGDKILVKGSLNAQNDQVRILLSVSAGSLTVSGLTFTTESAGNTITIYKIEFFADPGMYKQDEVSDTRFFYPAILGIGDVSYTLDNNSFVKLNDGTISINRKVLLGEDGNTKFNLNDKTKLFEFLVKLTHNDSILFENVPGIIRDINELSVTFQLKTEIPDADWLDDAADIEDTTYTQGRYLPKVIGTVYHFQPLLQYYSTYQYYSGGETVYNAYDDGQIVQFNSVSTSYLTGNTVQYNGNAYIANIDNPTTSPTGGATNNTGWNYTGVTSGENHFQAVAYNFTLNAAPVGAVTIDVSGEYNTLETLCETLAGFVKVPGQKVIGNGISFDNSTSKISDTAGQLGIFTGQGTDITGQRIMITGGTNDGRYFRVVSASASELTVSPAPTTESAGSTITVIGFYGFSSEFSDGSASINYSYQSQMKVIDVLKEICDFHEHIFYFNKSHKLMYLIDKTLQSATIQIDEYNLNLGSGLKFLTKDVIFSFLTKWVQYIPVINPTSLYEQERQTEILTGVGTGSVINIKQLENSDSALTNALEKKRDLYLNYDRIELESTEDGSGINTAIFPGIMIQFSGWFSGNLHVQEVVYGIRDGKTTARGLASDIVFVG